ncbi:fungal-specific transcription factor domain-containing protein [Stachybotrys elegans]|uniref:Fungal-specific transcription factor domain-containing protein n=1 Tax=Stachybotrys elegans TaxID=80388 RepID=A0A8K0SVQ9_9HYPO|nr:fungal-specific transcription factor domain-containing protein [Stachybotrys elegans]
MCWGIDAFFEHKYPITPILHRPHVEESLHRIACSPDAYALLTSCCAVLSLSPDILPKPPSPGSPSPILVPPTDFLLSETARARRYCNVAESQSLLHIQTSFFLFSAFFCMNKDDAAWFYLRESITMLQTLRLHEEATYSLLDPVDAAYGRRLFWVLFITERAYALQRHRPLTLQNTLALPCASPLCNDSDIMPGFLDLISLFGHFDTDFIASWNSSVPLAQPSESTHLSLLQELLKYALPSVSSYAPAQQADLLISQQWLKVMVWKHCVSKALLKTASGDDSMSLTYPASIARDVVLISKLLPTKAFEANGVGILEKIFDVGCSLADLVLLRAEANSASTMEVGPLDTLVELASILVTTLQGEFRHSGVLIDKVNQCLLMNVDRGLCLPEVEVLGDLESIESAVLGDEIIPF